MTQNDNGIQMKLISSLKRIKRLEDHNPLNPEKVKEIAQHIRHHKFHKDEPITIAQINGGDAIVDGFQRLEALIMAGKTYAPCVYIDATTVDAAVDHADRRQATRRDTDKYTLLHRLVHSNLNTHGGARRNKTSDDGMNTRITLAEFAVRRHVSESTVERIKARYYDRLSEEQYDKILSDKTAVYSIIAQLDEATSQQATASASFSDDATMSKNETKKRVMRPKDAGETTLFRALNLIVSEIEITRVIESPFLVQTE